MIQEKKKIDLILYSAHIKNNLKKRLFDELGLTYGEIIEHARELKYNGINKPNLSRYFNSSKPMAGSISHQTVVYLCVRYGISLKIIVKPENYVAQDCIETVKKIFNELE